MHSIRNDRDGRENVYAPSECLTDRAHRVAMGKLYPPTISTAGPALRRVGSYTLALLIKVVNRFISDTLPSAIKTFCRIASFGMPRRDYADLPNCRPQTIKAMTEIERLTKRVIMRLSMNAYNSTINVI